MRKALLLSVFAVSALLAMDPEARNVKSVYILRMGNGLDQLLASELTKSGVYTVTTDPQKADALFTDSLGEGFEKKYAELYPPPPKPEVKKEEKDEKKEEGGLTQAPMQRLGGASMGRGKGTIFLVERKSRNLLWSMNQQAKNTSTPIGAARAVAMWSANQQPRDPATKETVDKARRIVQQLKRDLRKPATKP